MPEENLTASSYVNSNMTGHYIYDCWDSRFMPKLSSFMGFLAFLLGLPLNAWVLRLSFRSVWKGRGARRDLVALDMFFFNSVIIELLFCLISPVIAINILIPDGKLAFIAMLLYALGLIGRSFSHSCICVERYLAVVHPIVFLRTRESKYLKYRVLCIAIIWLVMVGFCWSIVEEYPEFSMNALHVPFCLVLIIDCFCSFSIMWALSRPGPGDGRREGMHIMNRQASRMVLVLLLLMIVTYIPYLCTGILKHLLPHNLVCLSLGIAYCLTPFNSLLQPLLFLHKVGKLQFLWWAQNRWANQLQTVDCSHKP